MYRFDMAMQTNCYEGTELTQVSFGKYDLILNFSAGLDGTKSNFSIGVQSRVSTTIDGTPWNDDKSFLKHADTLLQCLGTNCSSFTIEDDRTLKIKFSNGTAIKLHDDSDQFESVTITQGDRTIVI
ncbi:DUF6188 family protein [Terriglobus roseus]|uniref:Uncharacterized protein n=1 Tax=Terriglobus roseus TaxID=392734 RepID=A0A1G7IA76_9BACT|nr:DUF6188 family protein [Terriglobus roseus]SDF09595.1 hypothetical protein SAMN05444167_1374 [Terriglobus roseus]